MPCIVTLILQNANFHLVIEFESNNLLPKSNHLWKTEKESRGLLVQTFKKVFRTEEGQQKAADTYLSALL